MLCLAQESAGVGNESATAAASSPGNQAVQSDPGVIDFSTFAAKMSFLVFLVLFIGAYMLLRMKPAEYGSKRNKRK